MSVNNSIIYTPNLNLAKPGYGDFADIKDLNDNFDKLDSAFGENNITPVPIYQVVDGRSGQRSFLTMRTMAPLGTNLGSISILTDKSTVDGGFEMAAPMNMHKVDWDNQARDAYRAYLGTRVAIYDVTTIGGEYIYMNYSGFNETLANSTGNSLTPRNCNVEIYTSLIWSEENGIKTNYTENPIRYAAYSGGGTANTPTAKTMAVYNGTTWEQHSDTSVIDLFGTLKIPLVSSPKADTKYCHRFYYYSWDNMATTTGNSTHWPVFSYYRIGQLIYTKVGSTTRLAPMIKGYYRGR